MSRVLLPSLTRIAPFDGQPLTGTVPLGESFTLGARPRHTWKLHDYVVGRVLNESLHQVPFELSSGRQVFTRPGDLVMGALGRRAATLECVGAWEDVGEDLRFDGLTPAGLFGQMTSQSGFEPDVIRLDYVGHVHVGPKIANMSDYLPEPTGAEFALPVVLIVGSSMSAGKTTTAREIIRVLTANRLRVVGAKVTGAGRYRDVLTMADSGAEWIFDFVDVGLASTVIDPGDYSVALDLLLEQLAVLPADVAVIEAGASPLEAYNGAVAMERLSPHVRCMVLCALDPYAVVGITTAFGRRPDLVGGACANTESGRALVGRLSNIDAVDTRGSACHDALAQVLSRRLERPLRG